MDRLLTDEEMDKIRVDWWNNRNPIKSYSDLIINSAKAQDAKTLKAVGEWVEEKYSKGEWIDFFLLLISLKSGEMPEMHNGRV